MARKQSTVLRDTLRGLRPIVGFSVLLSLVYGLLRLAGPLFMLLIFDRVLPSRSVPSLVALLVLIVIVLVAMTLIDYSRRRILARFGAQFQERIEDHIFNSTARDAYFSRVGSKPAAGLSEADQLRGFFHSSSLVTVLDFMWAPVFLGVVFIIDPFIGWVVTAGVSLLVLINTLKASFDKAHKERFDESSDKVGNLKEALLASRHVIESQQMMASYNKRWVLARRESRDAAIERNDWKAWFAILSTHTALLIQYTTLAAAAYLTINGQMTVGAMVASMRLSRLVYYPAEKFLKQVPSIQEAIGNWRALDKALSAGKSATVALEGPAALRLSHVTLRCPLTKNKLLRTNEIEITPGSSIEIVGRGNSGKTVLAEALIGRFPRASGKVQIGAVDIERLSMTDAAKTVGYVPQRVDFVSGTIEENIAGLDVEPDRERVAQVARLAQLHDKITSLPEGYLTRIDAVGSIFSKGERHQLAFARAVYPDPKLLIVDEPDSTFRDALSKGLKKEVNDFLAQGGILIVLTRLSLKRYQPARRFTLDGGALKENTPDPITEFKVVRLQNG